MFKSNIPVVAELGSEYDIAFLNYKLFLKRLSYEIDIKNVTKICPELALTKGRG
jgi:hypothetical protein